MKHSTLLSLAALSAALSLSLPTSAHDPKQFDQLPDAVAVDAGASACTKLNAAQKSKPAAAAAEIQSLQTQCDTEKKVQAQPTNSPTPAKK